MQKMASRTRNQLTRRSAFTLMEVLVVVAILVVLAGVGGVIFLRVQEDAYKDAARMQIKNLEKAAQTWQIKNGELPETLQELTVSQDGGAPLLEAKALIDPWNRPYQYAKQGQNAQFGKPDIWSEGPRPGQPDSRISNFN